MVFARHHRALPHSCLPAQRRLDLPWLNPVAAYLHLIIDPPQELSMEEAQKILTPMALSFYAGCVRVRNDKLKTALGVTLRYPTYREGLRALFDEGYEARDPLTAPR